MGLHPKKLTTRTFEPKPSRYTSMPGPGTG